MLKRFKDPSPYCPDGVRLEREWYTRAKDGAVVVAGIIIGTVLTYWLIL